MKTTSYEISKRLAEIGFKAKFDFVYLRDGKNTHFVSEIVLLFSDEIKKGVVIPSYDLETILEALPSLIEPNYSRIKVNLCVRKHGIFYENDEECQFYQEKEGESLADTAARRLIELHEQGLIKFGEKEPECH